MFRRCCSWALGGLSDFVASRPVSWIRVLAMASGTLGTEVSSITSLNLTTWELLLPTRLIPESVLLLEMRTWSGSFPRGTMPGD